MSHHLLKGKRGIIFGALNDMSIAWKVAERAVEEGARITLTNTPVAIRMGQVAGRSDSGRRHECGRFGRGLFTVGENSWRSD